MAYPFNDDHEAIREAARGWLQNWYDEGRGPAQIVEESEALDRSAWHEFAGQQGFAAIAIDETYGGAGLGTLGLCAVMEALGASLCAIPFLAGPALSASILQTFGSEAAKQDLLPKLAQASMIATYADGHDALSLENGKISGKIKWVLDAPHADWIFTTLRLDKKLALIAVPPEHPGVTVTAIQSLDGTRSFGDVELTDVLLSDSKQLGDGNQHSLLHAQIMGKIALAAECVGGAQKCLDMTLDYAMQRHQFDRPIASFQAYKHKAADLAVELQAARSALYAACCAPENEQIEAAIIAHAVCSEAYFSIAGQAIQLHGGIGFTWEYPLHYFFKRARSNQSQFGSSSRHWTDLADHLFGEVA